MISDVSFDLAGGSAVTAISPNGWHLAVVRHGVAIDFFDARDLCSSTPSSSKDNNSTLASALARDGGPPRLTSQNRSQKRKLGSLQGSFSTVDDVSALVWSPDSTMVAACMMSRGVISVVSAFSFQAIATIDAALNGTSSHSIWHPSSRALYWCGMSQTHVLSLIDGNTMVLDYHAKVVVDTNSDTASSAGDASTASLPLWCCNDPCPSFTSTGSISPHISKPLFAFTNGDGFACQQFTSSSSSASNNTNNNNQSNNNRNTSNNNNNNNISSTSTSGNNQAGTPPLFICVVSPCAVAAQPSVTQSIRKNMQPDPKNPNSQLVNMSSAQSVASTTNIMEEATGVINAPFDSKLNVTTEYFHVFSAIDHEHLFQFPIVSSSSPSSSNTKEVVDTGCEFFVTSFHVSPFFITFHDSFSSALVVYSHRGENIGPNKRNVVAYSVSSSDSVDGGATISMVHDRSCLSVFSHLASSSASPSLIQMYSVNLANPSSYFDPLSMLSSSSSSEVPLVVLAERIAPDDLLDRARNEKMTQKASAAHRADPANTLPVVPPNRAMYEVVLPPGTEEQAQNYQEQYDDFMLMSSSSSKNNNNSMSLIPGLRAKSLAGLCRDAKTRSIVEEFLRQAMRKTETRNMMDDVVTTGSRVARKSSSSNNTNTKLTSNVLTTAVYSRLVNSRNAVNANFNQTASSLGNNLHLLSADVLAEIAPLAFQTFGYCSNLSFHNTADHSNQLYVSAVVPQFPTCVFIIDVAAGKVVSIMQQENVITTLNWKPPREILNLHQFGSYLGNNNSSSNLLNSTNQTTRRRQTNHNNVPTGLSDPVLAFTTDSHNGCLYIWTPESALCVAMPEIAKTAAATAAKNNNNKNNSSNSNNKNNNLLRDKSLNALFSSSTNNEEEDDHDRVHVACEDPDCRRNWLHRKKDLARRRAFERGEIGGFRPTFAAWTDAGNTLLIVDTIRGSHTVASLVSS